MVKVSGLGRERAGDCAIILPKVLSDCWKDLVLLLNFFPSFWFGFLGDESTRSSNFWVPVLSTPPPLFLEGRLGGVWVGGEC